MLKVEDVHVYYGAIHALKGVSFAIARGELVTLLGANGAGKTTTLKTLSGLLRPQSGRIELEGASLNGAEPHVIVTRGVSHAPEGRKIFPRFNVLENLQIGGYTRTKTSLSADIERVFGLFPRLKERQKQVAGTLSGGEQQMLAIGRALMVRPKLLLLDEPSMGLAPKIVEQILATIKSINESGVTVLLVEQNAAMALAISHRGYVLETGAVVLQGTASELAGNDFVRQAYLGG
jgi:branched-chain amino acid transport system ATP-binding protein